MVETVNAHRMNNVIQGATSLTGGNVQKTPIGVVFVTHQTLQPDGSVQTVSEGTDPKIPGSIYEITQTTRSDGSYSFSASYNKNGVPQYSQTINATKDAAGVATIVSDATSLDNGSTGPGATATNH